MRPTPPPLVDTLWTLLCAKLSLHMDAVLALVHAVIAADSPRARPEQRQLRRAAASAMAALKLSTFFLDGVRITLADAPSIDVDGETVITGASRLRVSFNAKERQAAKARQHVTTNPIRGMLSKPRSHVATVIDLAEARERALAKKATDFNADMEYATDVEAEILAKRAQS